MKTHGLCLMKCGLRSTLVFTLLLLVTSEFAQPNRTLPSQNKKPRNRLTGDYTLTDGSNISILEVELGLAFFNFKTGRFGILHKDPSEQNVYFAGPGAIGTTPKEIEIRFIEVRARNQRLNYSDLSEHVPPVVGK
jgi:hypothetical protein